jgi:hypothetical protein
VKSCIKGHTTFIVAPVEFVKKKRKKRERERKERGKK